ncbi:MAG: nucleotidyltransferase domain-containing protein [Tissierellia bacterium]|nr:nucleotidyltransferase domain-containing protein [Tissierellia bacterium]
MKNEKIYSPNEIAAILQPVFERNKVHRVTLFGSFAKGKATKYSDIDLCIKSDLIGLDFYGLKFEIEDEIKKEIDVIEEREIVKPSPIMSEIENFGVLIYERT